MDLREPEAANEVPIEWDRPRYATSDFCGGGVIW